MLPTRDKIEGMCPHISENVKDYAYRWRQRTSNLKQQMIKEDMISTFLTTLGPTYQLMLLIASQGNFSKVIGRLPV